MAFRFGEFLLDPRTGQLVGPEGPVPLRRQAFRLAEVLLEHAPRLLDRDTLLDAVWGHDALSPNALPQTISELRRALGDDAQAPRYIETKHRRGYRIVCPVERVDREGLADAHDAAGAASVMEAEREAPADTSGNPPSTVVQRHAGTADRGVPDAATDAPPVAGPLPPPRRQRQRAAALAALAALSLFAVVFALVAWQREARVRTLHADTIPQIRERIDTDLFGAWRLAREARREAPDDPTLAQLWRDLTLPVDLATEPPGAELAVLGYRERDGEWLTLGRTPLEGVRLPLTQLRLRATLEGHAPVEVAPGMLPEPEPIRLHPPQAAPEGMVFVPAGSVRYLGIDAELPDFWIGRHEVSNRDYLAFIEDGGYARAALWPEAVATDEGVLERDALIARFVDRTGLPGPATWALGTYPDGTGAHPVAGVSWFEAAAYARWAGKALPTVFHWRRAAGLGTAQVANFSDILAASNFDGRGTQPVGAGGGLGPYGSFDMAGNVAEWCRNATGTRRHILGASWMDNGYQFLDADAQPALTRRPGFGFRLMEQAAPLEPALLADVAIPSRASPPPVDEDSFRRHARMFDYDAAPLAARVEHVDDSHDGWRRERVSFAAAYGGERVEADLFLPRRGRAPWPAVVHLPGGDALMLASIEEAGLLHVEPFLRSGRAVVYPVVDGTFQRRGAPPPGPIAAGQLLVRQVKDLRRTLDYLATREDIHQERIGLHGLSWGGWRAVYALAVEPRFRTGMLMSAGLPATPLPEEVQLQDYLPRVTQPMLLISGRDDFAFPLQSSQRPFFELLGTDPAHKRHVVLDWGHLPPGYTDVVRELLAWSERWLPVTGTTQASQRSRVGGDAPAARRPGA